MGKRNSTQKAAVAREISDVEKANNAIREAHRLGQKINAKIGPWAAHGAMKEVAVEFGVTPEKARKLRQIAEVYTEAELEALLSWCTFYDRAIGVSYLYKIVSIPKDEDQRTKFEEEMLAEGWSYAEIDRRIQARFGRRREPQKRRRVPGDKLGLVSMIESESYSWGRWLRDVLEKAGKLPEAEQLPDDLVRQLEAASAQVAKLQQLAERELEKARAAQ
jgi:hypothetical protein